LLHQLLYPLSLLFFPTRPRPPRATLFPTRRSSDLAGGGGTCTINLTFTPSTTGSETDQITITDNAAGSPHIITVTEPVVEGVKVDRKSTRLNSSHVSISYAVFCLKKKKNTNT